jgi:hypothetical protein
VLNGIERQLAVLTDRKSWDEIPYKALQGPPQAFSTTKPTRWERALLPDARTRRTGLHRLVVEAAEHRWRSSRDHLPPGYNRLIVNGLAIALCPENGMEAPASVVRAFNRRSACSRS